MANFRRLTDFYRFPGFEPLPRIRGVFGDPKAVLISLRRVRKKRSAVLAERSTSATTINGLDGSATSPLATNAFISPSLFEGSSVFYVMA